MKMKEEDNQITKQIKTLVKLYKYIFDCSWKTTEKGGLKENISHFQKYFAKNIKAKTKFEKEKKDGYTSVYVTISQEGSNISDKFLLFRQYRSYAYYSQYVLMNDIVNAIIKHIENAKEAYDEYINDVKVLNETSYKLYKEKDFFEDRFYLTLDDLKERLEKELKDVTIIKEENSLTIFFNDIEYTIVENEKFKDDKDQQKSFIKTQMKFVINRMLERIYQILSYDW